MKYIREGAHKAGCECGFCKNKGNIHKRGKDSKKDEEGEKKPTAESVVTRMLDDE